MIEFGDPAVRSAVRRQHPVVALETAVLTHGLPRPRNLEAVRAMAAAVQRADAVPAVVGIVRGRLLVGMSGDALAELAHDDAAEKAGPRELPQVLARGGSAGTTVAGTLEGCRLAGIRVFATGGIGGVHRGWQETLDVSADLDALARTPTCVVSSGVKSILDVPATLEALETRSVCVLGWRTDAFPQFYTEGEADVAVPQRVDALDEVARLLRLRWERLRQDGGVLLANPVPAEAALDPALVAGILEEALAVAAERGIRGAATTPFLLDHLSRASEGRTLEANVALLESNARLAGELAHAIAVDARRAR